MPPPLSNSATFYVFPVDLMHCTEKSEETGQVEPLMTTHGRYGRVCGAVITNQLIGSHSPTHPTTSATSSHKRLYLPSLFTLLLKMVQTCSFN
ncbi:hypothetical protein E2C01_008962 [Portunus trituberculatus]|uniref:Uncharacterized protein n=1 Tax=Portunus trituberculatus TaxID=210409 RepID=A0A5B7D5N1_PORTR|nr:hypothetical protein [Portunus trituberculatus]